MTKITLGEQIQKLIKDESNRSKAARFREVYKDIEAALSAGIPIETVHKTLVKNGLNLTLESFRTTLYRTRKAQKAKPKIENQTVKPEHKTTGNDEPAEAENNTSTNPADIDRIMNSTPNLDELAKLARKGKHK